MMTNHQITALLEARCQPLVPQEAVYRIGYKTYSDLFQVDIQHDGGWYTAAVLGETMRSDPKHWIEEMAAEISRQIG